MKRFASLKCVLPLGGLLIVLLASVARPAEPAAEDWPWWRGPNLDNIAADPQDPPIRWSETENVVWKADVPGRGHGSPCLWGNRLFLPTADEEAKVQYVFCFDRSSGRELWRTEVHRGDFMRKHWKDSFASATPACDGRYVFMPFVVQGGIWLTALDFDGEKVWQKKLGDFTSMHGYGASPQFYKSTVIVVSDSVQGSFLTAVERRTGKTVWRVNRPDYRLGTYACPIVGHVAGRDQLLIHGPYKVFSYDPATGKLLWTCDGPCESTASTMSLADNVVYASGGFPRRKLLCIRADGSGDVTNTHVVWMKSGRMAYVPSLLLAGGLLYMVEDEGRTTCYEAETGKVVWNARLDGKFSSSPVLAAGHIYVANEEGVLYVFKSGQAFRLVARNDLADGGYATPVVVAGRIYLRTLHHLYCLGKPKRISHGPARRRH